MKASSNNTTTLTPSEISHILITMMIGVGILGATGPIEAAGNDGWISVIVGALYPLYIVSLALIISKRCPDDNIIIINKKLFGKYLGSLLSLYISGIFIFYLIEVIASFSFITRIFIANFIPEFIIIIITMVLISYLASKELKIIAKVNVIIFYLTFILVLLPGYALLKGSYLNLLPVFNSSVSSIIDGGIKSIGRYAGIEVVFIIYPFISDKTKLKSAVFKGVGIVAAIYGWLTIVTIYYLGPDVAIKFYWPVLIIADSVQIPIINIFRYIFMLLWSLIIYRINANMLYFSSVVIKDIIKPKKHNSIILFISVIAVISSIIVFFIDNESINREIGKIEPYLALIFTIYITIVALLVVLLKKNPDKMNE